MGMSQREAWRDSDVLIIKGIVDNFRHDNGTAYYEIRVLASLKVLKRPIPKTITVVDPHYMTSAMVYLKEKEHAVLFVQKLKKGDYRSHRELRLASPSGQEALRGLELFLGLMSMDGEAKQRRECLKAWRAGLSDTDKRAVLDAMYETRCLEYADLLMDIARGRDTPRLRSWAVTILTCMNKSPRYGELIGLLDDPDSDVRRQALVFLGVHKVREAVPRMEKFLKENIEAPSESDAENLRKKAREALDKITGKNKSPYRKN